MTVRNLFRACRSPGWAVTLGILLLALSQVTAWAQVGSPSAAPIPVKVGGYIFPPFVELDGDGHPRGVTPGLIDAMNAWQKTYHFEFALTSPERRYQDFENGAFDMMFFENSDWGWNARHITVDASEVFLHGGEIYIAKNAPGRDQHYFDDLASKRLVGILGYHYGFAGFDGDPAMLRQKWHMTLVNDNLAGISLILKDRYDVAVVTQDYLNRYLTGHPNQKQALLISTRLDQKYEHRILVRPGIHPSAVEIDQILNGMKRDGSLDRFLTKVGLRSEE